MNLLKKATESIENKMQINKSARVTALTIVTFNYLANTIFPLILIGSGQINSESNNYYVILLWGSLITTTAIYFYTKLAHDQLEYFNSTVPAFIISSYLISITAGFILGVLLLPFAPLIDNLGSVNLLGTDIAVLILVNSATLLIEVAIFFWTIYSRRINV